MSFISKSILFATAGLLALPAQARIFDFKNEHFAAYLGGSFGSSALSDTAYAQSSGAGTSVDKSVQTTSSGEFGFLMAGSRFNLKVGAEYIMPRDQKGVIGTDSAGKELFFLDSTIGAFVPMASIEFLPYKGTTNRGLLGLGYGYGVVTLDNTYTMQSAGKTAFNNIGDYKESASGTTHLLQAYVGWETLFSDTMTTALTVGYRWMNVPTLKATKAVNTINGNLAENDELTNRDGGKRALNLSGVFVNLNFRFYLGF